jgi:LysR family hydrogen peroxide-inducible transcriptional activator
MHIVDCTNSVTVLPEMAIPFVPEKNYQQIKTLAKGAMSRKISLAVRRTYVKHSIISALRESVLERRPVAQP